MKEGLIHSVRIYKASVRMKLKTDFELVNMTITGDLNTFWWGDEAEI